MKILQVITKSNLGGAQSVVVNLANALCRDKHEVLVVAGEGGGQIFTQLDERIQKYPMNTLHRAVSFLYDTKALLELSCIYHRFKPDIIHLHSSKAGILGRLIFPRRKIVYTVHGFDSIRLAFRKFLPIERLMQYQCASIVGVSIHDVKTMAAEGIHRNVSLVHNGINPPNDTHLNVWDLPHQFRKIVLCIARLSPPKRSDLFIQVAESIPDYAFVWIGNQHPVESHPKNVFFMGNVPNASRLCRHADLFILPSNYEGLPMVVLEAMAAGIPVVASRVGGVTEAVIDGKTGFAVDNTCEDFKKHIQLILENNDLYRKMSQTSVISFQNKFTCKSMVSKYLMIYNNIYHV